MPADFFQGLFDTDMTSVIAPSDFLLCVFCALVIGLILAAFYMYRIPRALWQRWRCFLRWYAWSS